MSEKSKTTEEEPKTVSLPDFLNKSFECLFNQNVECSSTSRRIQKTRRKTITIRRKN